MSYIEKSRQNKANAEKAQAFDAIHQQRRDKQTYDAGATDAYTEVERELMARAEQAAMQRQVYEAAQNQQFANQNVWGTDTPPVLPAPTEVPTQENGLAASIQQNIRDNAYSRAIVKAQQDGNMSEDYINRLVEQELLKSGGL